MRRLVSVLAVLAVCGAIAACRAPEDPTHAANVQAVSLEHAEVWSKGAVDLIPELYTEDFVGHFPGGQTVRGHDGIRSTVESHRVAFPDWHESIVEVVVEGDIVVSRFRSTGTHLGPFLGHPPTGNRVEILEAAMRRMEEGRIAEMWVFPDVMSLLSQISSDPRGSPLEEKPGNGS